MFKLFAYFSAIIYAFLLFLALHLSYPSFPFLSFFIAVIANRMVKSCRLFGSFSHSARRPTFFRSQLHTLPVLNYCVFICYYSFSISIFRVTEFNLDKIVTMKSEAVRFSETWTQTYYPSLCKNQ